jgi:ribosomal-protein-alanine N-acetyltransferase
VEVAARRKGVGNALLAQTELLAVETVCNAIRLEVRPTNHAALALYRLRGYTEDGRRPRFYANPVEDALLMTLCIR